MTAFLVPKAEIVLYSVLGSVAESWEAMEDTWSKYLIGGCYSIIPIYTYIYTHYTYSLTCKWKKTAN